MTVPLFPSKRNFILNFDVLGKTIFYHNTFNEIKILKTANETAQFQ